MTEGSFELAINVLGYREDGDWLALALDMDLRGYGATFDDALADLNELIEMQVSFALERGEPGLVLHPADPIWFERFADVRRERLAHLAAPRSESARFLIAGLPLPAPHVIADLSKPGFRRVDA